MDPDNIKEACAQYRRSGNIPKEKEFLMNLYIQHPEYMCVRDRLRELGEIHDELLLAKPKAIFECEWREGFGATLHMLCTRFEYCLRNGFYLSLPSPLGFGYWTDYFKPFWSEEEKKRIYSVTPTVTKTQPRLSIYRDHIAGFRQKNGKNLFTKSCYGYILRHMYNLRDDVTEKVNAIVASVNLPQDYTVVHIRKGDRVGHRNCPCNVTLEAYVQAIRQINPGVQRIFVATDDVRFVEEMRRHFHVDSLTLPTQHGFNDPMFFKTSYTEKEAVFLQLFAEIAIAARSQYFVGTYCSVLSHLMQAQHGLRNSILLY